MKTPAALIASALLAGCTHTTYTDPSGARFSRTSFLTKQSVGRVEVSASAAEKRLSLEGYANEQTETAAAVAGAVAKALSK